VLCWSFVENRDENIPKTAEISNLYIGLIITKMSCHCILLYDFWYFCYRQNILLLSLLFDDRQTPVTAVTGGSCGPRMALYYAHGWGGVRSLVYTSTYHNRPINWAGIKHTHKHDTMQYKRMIITMISFHI